MAGAGYKTFTAGDVLLAAEVQTYLMDQSIPVFASSTARGSAIPSPTEGMMSYLEDSDAVQVYTTGWEDVGVAPAVLQVVSTTKTDTFSSSSTSYTDVTGLSVSITPSATSSKVLVLAGVGYCDSSDSYASQFTLARGGVNLSNPDSPGSRTPVFWTRKALATQEILNAHISFLDSPSSTSSLTYNIRVKSENAGNAIYVNRDRGDTNNTSIGRGVSTITVMEVAG